MRILKLEALSRSWDLLLLDTFNLIIGGVIVHSAHIDQARRISHWALVEIVGGVGYFVGDERLELELAKYT